MMTRVYLPAGNVAHLLDELLSPNQPNSALCGRAPFWPELWHGTGSQYEEERAADFRTCVECLNALDRRRSGVLER